MRCVYCNLLPELADGYSGEFTIFTAAILKVSPAAVRLLNGIGVLAVGFTPDCGMYNWVFMLSIVLQTPPALNPAGHNSPKFPMRSSALITWTDCVDGASWRCP